MHMLGKAREGFAPSRRVIIQYEYQQRQPTTNTRNTLQLLCQFHNSDARKLNMSQIRVVCENGEESDT